MTTIETWRWTLRHLWDCPYHEFGVSVRLLAFDAPLTEAFEKIIYEATIL